MSGRPAEVGAGAAGALAFIVCYLLQVDDPALLYSVTIVVGFVPAAITWCVERWRGKDDQPAVGQ